MTTLREDAVNGIISKESPLVRAVMGRRVGDRALVKVNDEIQYYIRILSIAKGQDDDRLPISSFYDFRE
jgi:transcription elongation factor GreA